MNLFFEWLFSQLRELRFFVIIRSYQAGVKFRLGIADAQALTPGLHWIRPLMDEVEVIGVKQETKKLPTQSVMTQDGKTVSFSAAITYEVTDAVAHFCNVLDFVESLEVICMTHMSRKVSEWTLAEMAAHRAELERSLRTTLTTRTAKWGATIVDVGLTDLTETPAFRLYGDSQHSLFS